MDERRLRYFLAVADTESVTRAARRLHITQPSLSQALRSLEAELGVQLFDRSGGRLRLSDAGTALLRPAQRVLESVAEAREALTDVGALRSGSVRIATLATLAVDPVAGLIGRFRAAHPGVRLSVVEPETADGVASLVRSGSAELGAAHLTATNVGLVVAPLGVQELLLVLPPGTPGDPGRPLSRTELARIPFIVSPPGTSTRTLLEQALGAVGIAPEIAVETAARESVVALVLAGAGAALLPAPLAAEARRRGATLRALRPAITRPIGLLHRDRPLSTAAAAFLALAVDAPPRAT
ncbi:LysR family transcriptional regulator [Conexibacter sp. DBS9H8]|uniref:LysR family transcriptional regulator n=1 Tax=Conexibacter sp. DBS9H8 TaxID=2937801 RepID=UPI00200D59C2|nr:LysR substrate-binding domain-containing protein [Conexibacter sp. DBS9H8]